MKKIVWLLLDPNYKGNEQQRAELVAHLGKKVLQVVDRGVGVYFRLYDWKEDDITLLRKLLQNQGYNTKVESIETIYERKDLEACEYVCAFGPRANDNSKIDVISFNTGGDDPEYDNTNFNERYSKGGKQLLPLRCVWYVKRPLGYTLYASTWRKHWFIGDEIKALLEKERLTGIKYFPVHKKNGEPIDGVWQIMPDSELPPGMFSDRLYKDKNDPDYYDRLPFNKNYRLENLVLKQEAKRYLKDFTETYERPLMADRGHYIMSIKMARLFRDIGISPGPILCQHRCRLKRRGQQCDTVRDYGMQCYGRSYRQRAKT